MRARTLLLIFVAAAVPLSAQRGGGPPAGPPRTVAPIDLTGNWVSIVSMDWRWRMVTPAKGDYSGIPMNQASKTVADAWDPAKDEAAGEQCKAYGAAGIMRLPTRIRIAWQDDTTLKLDADAGTQTRLFYFGPPQGSGGEWQGLSSAVWAAPRALFAARGGGPPSGGSLKVVTTRMKPGYLRKNGVPYGANAVLTEYFDRFDVPGGDSLLIVTSEIVDAENLLTPYWTSQQFKREDGQTGWNPTPCAAR